MLAEQFGLALQFALGFQPQFKGRAFAIQFEPAPLRVIQREVFEPRAAEPLLECREIQEVVASREQLDPFAMAGHPDIGQMAVHARRGQHEAALDRGPLGLVHGRRIAVIEGRVVIEAELDFAPFPAVQLHPRVILVDFEHAAEAAVLDPELAIVLEEHHALACSHAALAAFQRERAVGRHQFPFDADRDLPAELIRAL